jgi:hypothetical protein
MNTLDINSILNFGFSEKITGGENIANAHAQRGVSGVGWLGR